MFDNVLLDAYFVRCLYKPWDCENDKDYIPDQESNP